MTTRTIAALLVAAFVFFPAGAAFGLVREFEQPLAIRQCSALRAVCTPAA
jgi:hypothetical protein